MHFQHAGRDLQQKTEAVAAKLEEMERSAVRYVRPLPQGKSPDFLLAPTEQNPRQEVALQTE